MAWSFDAGTISPGASVRWRFWWNGFAYKGIQVVQARQKLARGDWAVNPLLELVVTDPGLKSEPGGYSYLITVTNRGWAPVEYEMVGDEV